MDPIVGGVVILVFIVIVPMLLASVTLTTYLYAAGLVVFVVVGYVWVVDRLAPSPSESHLRSRYGLRQLYPEADGHKKSRVFETVTTTIIFVHGLGADPSATWTDTRGSRPCCWITDLFPDDLRDSNLHSSVRLCNFDYNSYWMRNSTMTLRATAVSLLQELQNTRSNIILVGHSFGGIVIKQALVISPELKSRLKGVAFLGTPHQGTSFNRYGLLASYLLLPLDPDIEIMRILAPESNLLDGLQRDFEKHFSSTPRKYFYESKKTQRNVFGFLTLLREYVVTRQSATHGATEMNTIRLETDHRSLNKFSDRDGDYTLLTRALLSMVPQTISISASEFICYEIDCPDADYPGRKFWYREQVGSTGYPAGVRVDPEYASSAVRPIGDSILTCKRTVNILVRYRLSHLTPGLYHVRWIFWFWAGRDFVPSHEQMPPGFVPKADRDPENSVCERFFPVEGQSTGSLDSPFFYPWELRCSVGRPRDYDKFLHTFIDARPHMHPLSAPVLLEPGFSETEFEPGFWRTMKNTGWSEVRDQTFQVGEDGEIAFVIGNRFVPHWLGGFSFGGLKLEPIEQK